MQVIKKKKKYIYNQNLMVKNLTIIQKNIMYETENTKTNENKMAVGRLYSTKPFA